MLRCPFEKFVVLIGSEVFVIVIYRVDFLASQYHFIVQVRTVRASGVAYFAYQFSAKHFFCLW